jgi:hypothetical protein
MIEFSTIWQLFMPDHEFLMQTKAGQGLSQL